MKKGHEHVAVVKSFYSTTRSDYLPVSYEIEVDDHSITTISESAALYIYEELGKLLTMKQEGGKS